MSPAAQAKKRLLLVEDDSATVKALEYVLKYAGHEVASVATLAQALDHLNRNAPDVVILDLMLPDGDGTAVLERARATAPHIKVIITTGVSDPQRLARVQKLGPHALLSKPLRIDALLALL